MTHLGNIACPRVRAVPARPEEVKELQFCLDGTPRYHRLTQGTRADPGAAARLLDDAAADPSRRVFLLWPRRAGPPLGVLDLELHQPEPLVAHVGLLLLREAVQGLGLGREVVEGLARALARAGFAALRLSVGDENPGARAFWEGMGAEPVGRLDRGVTVYELRLSPDERRPIPPHPSTAATGSATFDARPARPRMPSQMLRRTTEPNPTWNRNKKGSDE